MWERVLAFQALRQSWARVWARAIALNINRNFGVPNCRMSAVRFAARGHRPKSLRISARGAPAEAPRRLPHCEGVPERRMSAYKTGLRGERRDDVLAQNFKSAEEL